MVSRRFDIPVHHNNILQCMYVPVLANVRRLVLRPLYFNLGQIRSSYNILSLCDMKSVSPSENTFNTVANRFFFNLFFFFFSAL